MSTVKSMTAVVALLAVITLPLALAWSRIVPQIGEDWGDSLLAIGKAAGILGLALILIAGALSIRVPRLDAVFGGLPRLWQFHHVLAFLGFLLVLTHVWLIGVSALPISKELPADILFPALESYEIWLGWLALGALFAFLAPSFKFFGAPRYQGWKHLHMAAAPAALLIALIHGTSLAPDDAVWWFLGALAVASVAWRRIGSRLALQPYIVEGVERLAPDVVEIDLRPQNRAINFHAGQFVYLTPADPRLEAGRGEEHPFSLASAPQDPHLRVGIKALGDASRALQTVSIGSRIWVDGPYGQFLERRHPDRGQLWLGGGIGITPMIGGARALARQGPAQSEVHLLYLADSRERAYYLNTLELAAREAPALTLTVHYFSSEGTISVEFIATHCPDFAEREIYLCGPLPMLAHLQRILRKHGVPRTHIHSEEFTFL